MINKAVIDVARTYHVLANLYLPKILYHLDNTVPLLAGYVTDSDYQRYRIFDEKFNVMVSGYIPASESPDLKARARPKFSKVDLAVTMLLAPSPQGHANCTKRRLTILVLALRCMPSALSSAVLKAQRE